MNRFTLLLPLVVILSLYNYTGPASAEPPKPLNVEGFAFQIGTLEESGTVYSNRTYQLTDLPKQLLGQKFTQLGGGVRAKLRVTSPDRRQLLVIAGKSMGDKMLADWTPVDAPGLHYTDANRTPLGVYSRTVEPNVTLEVPQCGWTGTMVVAAEIDATVLQPKLDLTLAPGIVIDHSPASSGDYIGSPSITHWTDPDGRTLYIASHDLFGPAKTYETIVLQSADQGQTWQKVARFPQFWSTLFEHRGSLYLIGSSSQYGYAVIRRSDDGGHIWTNPTDKKHGLLLDDGKYHCAPQPVTIHNGRIWRAMEDAEGPGGWGSHFRAFMMSAPVDADLLDAESWRCSNRIQRDPDWLDGNFGGWLEGNAVVDPDGQIVNILRADYRAGPEQAAMIHVSPDGKTAEFDPENDFFEMPGGCKKFTIRQDPESKRYWTLCNAIPEQHRDGNPERARNTLVLMCSDDLRMWTIRSVLIYHPDSLYHGYQYPDWQFEGDDIIAVVRTAHNDGLGGANNQHDANFMTFHRVHDFRNQTDIPDGIKFNGDE